MQVPVDKLVATISLTAILGLCGVGFVAWKAIEGFQDSHGLIVGIIFVVCTVIQALFSVGWWRKLKNTDEYMVPTTEQEMRSLDTKA